MKDVDLVVSSSEPRLIPTRAANVPTATTAHIAATQPPNYTQVMTSVIASSVFVAARPLLPLCDRGHHVVSGEWLNSDQPPEPEEGSSDPPMLACALRRLNGGAELSPEEITWVMHQWVVRCASVDDCKAVTSGNQAVQRHRRSSAIGSVSIFYSKILQTRAARLDPRWEAPRGHCMGCDAPIRSGVHRAAAALNPWGAAAPAAAAEHHCRACGWAVCTRCCPPEQTLPLERWVSSTEGHPIRRAVDSICLSQCMIKGIPATKKKRVCKFCMIDQPRDEARPAASASAIPACMQQQAQMAARAEERRTERQLVRQQMARERAHARGDDGRHYDSAGMIVQVALLTLQVLATP